MENFAQNIELTLQYLLPGFISAWVFHGLTAYPKTTQFERVIHALIFTMFVQALLQILKSLLIDIGVYWNIGEWNASSEIVWSVIIALFIGFVFSYFANNDKLHKLFRKMKISNETSYPSEWFSVFHNEVKYVVLHLHDERRLYGWPLEWPSKDDSGHFVIEDPSWLIEKGKEIPILRVKKILINVKDVKWVEVMANNQGNNDGKEKLESTSS